MVVLNAHLDDGRVVLDEPLPEHLSQQAKVRVVIEESPAASTAPDDEEDVLARIAALGKKMDLPPDYAAQHHHYTDGVPRR